MILKSIQESKTDKKEAAANNNHQFYISYYRIIMLQGTNKIGQSFY